MHHIKKGWAVCGLNSPFVHGQVVAIEGEFVRLDNGGVYPQISLKRISARALKKLPNFGRTLAASKICLNRPHTI